MKIVSQVDPQACNASQDRNGGTGATAGMILGATQLVRLGIFCGPAALECSAVLFVAGGIGGYLKGREAGEKLTADFANSCRLDQFEAPTAPVPAKK